jgi:hypothetical protein
VHIALAIYAVGAAVGLVLTDARPLSRTAVALLWPIGPLAFALTITLLVAASLVAFPAVGAAVAALGLGAWLILG